MKRREDLAFGKIITQPKENSKHCKTILDKKHIGGQFGGKYKYVICKIGLNRVPVGLYTHRVGRGGRGGSIGHRGLSWLVPLNNFTFFKMRPAATMFAVGAAYMVSIRWMKGPEKPKCCSTEDSQEKLTLAKAFSASREIMAIWSLVLDLACLSTVRTLHMLEDADQPWVKPARAGWIRIGMILVSLFRLSSDMGL